MTRVLQCSFFTPKSFHICVGTPLFFSQLRPIGGLVGGVEGSALGDSLWDIIMRQVVCELSHLQGMHFVILFLLVTVLNGLSYV